MVAESNKFKHGYVISDLHIFTKWSSVDKYMNDIRKAAADADFFVFNGDIFDFRWSTLGSSRKTAKKAIEWLQSLCSEFPSCVFYYILGNHDAHLNFIELLAKFAEKTDNFKWNDSYFKIGTSLFMHGDLIFTMRDISPFKRKKFKKREPNKSMIRSAYHRMIKMGAHNVASKIHGKERCARYVLKVIKKKNRNKLKNITDIYIGHTHMAFSDFKYKGYIFHNSGSAIHDLHCNMMKVKRKNRQS